LRENGLVYFRGDLMITNNWIKKYALKDKKGEFLESSPDDTIKRVTKELHRIESKYPNPLSEKKIYKLLKDFKYAVFGGSVLFGAGNNEQVSSLANCFFIDNGADSYGGIFNLEESMAQLMKRRGGVGITLEHLRPKSAFVNNAANTSTGMVSFMDRFSNGTREVAQDGRRGALMLTASINHPDSEYFVDIKSDPDKVTGANISLKVSDEFMKSVEENGDFFLTWPEKKQNEIKEILPYNKLHIAEDGTYIKKIKSKNLWDKIVKEAHRNAEPGILFWDNIINESPSDVYSHLGFKTKGTNPCSEIPLAPWDSCRLSSHNLFSYVENPFTREAEFRWDKLSKNSRILQRLMDDIIDLEEEKIDLIIQKIERDPEEDDIKRTEISVES
jgi:ribonucleoside-diphosphate reductase alpha chain